MNNSFFHITTEIEKLYPLRLCVFASLRLCAKKNSIVLSRAKTPGRKELKNRFDRFEE